MNSSNNPVAGSRTWYLPFGGYRPGSAPTQTITDRDFTGQRENMELGLLYYNARYYVPGLGRFASADSIIPNPAVPQSYNRYSYVYNDPLNYTDPSGHCRYNANGEYEFGTDCTVNEFNELSWEDRMRWMQDFMDLTGIDWFDNIMGILEFFAADTHFSVQDGWASFSDAGVLQAIQDGWRIHNGQDAIGHYVANEYGYGRVQAGQLWSEFFALHERRFELADETVLESDVFSMWGRAEQSGVDYGMLLAESRLEEAGMEEQLKVDTFVSWGNVYRSIVSAGGNIPQVTNPRNSGGFVYAFGTWYTSPRGTARYNNWLLDQTMGPIPVPFGP